MSIILKALILIIGTFFMIMNIIGAIFFMPIILLMAIIGFPIRDKQSTSTIIEEDHVSPRTSYNAKDNQNAVATMIVYTGSKLLENYKKASDRATDVKNFRLYYQDKPTNLIWYVGKIIFVPKEYFLLKNLANFNAVEKHKCSLFACDVHLIDELKKNNIKFVLKPNLRKLLSGLETFGTSMLSDEVSIEFISDEDYSEINEPIYIGDGVWLNTGYSLEG
jgi:hypothetical protein